MKKVFCLLFSLIFSFVINITLPSLAIGQDDEIVDGTILTETPGTNDNEG